MLVVMELDLVHGVLAVAAALEALGVMVILEATVVMVVLALHG